MRRWTAERGLDPVIVGADGAAMLALSILVILASLGGSFVAVLARVIWTATTTPTRCAPSATILVLGMQLAPDGLPGPGFRARLDRALVLAALSNAKVIVLGGRTREGGASEAESGRDYLIERALDVSRIGMEDRSRHTLENLRLYRAASSASDDGVPVVVTSRYHLARTGLMADGLGIVHRLCAAEDRRMPSPAGGLAMLKEAVLLHWYMTGRSFSRLTRNRRMLARIT